MKEFAWAVMFVIPWPNTTMDKLVIYDFETEQECLAAVPGIKRKHRLFYKTITCKQMKDRNWSLAEKP